MDYENICFVVMPFGTRDVGGVQVDFDHIYETVLKPAVDGARTPEGEVLQARRTDHDFFSGLITQDMFDYLEFSRLVLADITSLNANVFYELGIRHTLRESGTIIVRQPGVTLPFDIRMAKAFPYEYQPDESAEESRQLIRKVVAESLVEERLDSPVQATMRFHRKRSEQTEALALAVENEVRQLDPWGAIRRLRDLIKRPDATAFDRMKLGLLLKEQGDWDEAIQLTVHQVAGDRVIVKQDKTGQPVDIPQHPRLQNSLAATKLGHLVILTTQHGKPYSEKGFGNWIKKAAVAAGLPHCSAHGLRKAAARRLAEAGCSPHEIMAITGHQSLKEIERYTRDANRRGLADGAMTRIA